MTKLNDVTLALSQITDETELSPELIEIATKWLNNDIVKMELALAYDDWVKETSKFDEEPQSLVDHITYYLEHPFLLGDYSTIVGLSEFAEIIGWDKARLSTKYSRQREGKKVRPRIPEPIQILASTPLWTKAQASKYREILESTEK